MSTSWQSSMQAPSECPRSCCPVSLARTHMRDALCALQKHVCQVGMPVAHASLNRSSPCRLQLSARVRGGLDPFPRLVAGVPHATALAGGPGGTSTPGRRARASLVWGAPRDGESSRGAGTGQSCRFILHWCKSELRGTQASFHACPLTRRERRRAQRLRAIETRDASLTDVSALKALEQREKAALAAMLTLKAQTEYQDNSHSSLHERDLLKTGGRGDNARAHKRCHVCSSHNLELTLCREMGILAPVSRYRLLTRLLHTPAGSIVLIVSGLSILLCVVASSGTTHSLVCLFCCDSAHVTLAVEKGYGTSCDTSCDASIGNEATCPAHEPQELSACA